MKEKNITRREQNLCIRRAYLLCKTSMIFDMIFYSLGFIVTVIAGFFIGFKAMLWFILGAVLSPSCMVFITVIFLIYYNGDKRLKKLSVLLRLIVLMCLIGAIVLIIGFSFFAEDVIPVYEYISLGINVLGMAVLATAIINFLAEPAKRFVPAKPLKAVCFVYPLTLINYANAIKTAENIFMIIASGALVYILNLAFFYVIYKSTADDYFYDNFYLKRPLELAKSLKRSR